MRPLGGRAVEGPAPRPRAFGDALCGHAWAEAGPGEVSGLGGGLGDVSSWVSCRNRRHGQGWCGVGWRMARSQQGARDRSPVIRGRGHSAVWPPGQAVLTPSGAACATGPRSRVIPWWHLTRVGPEVRRGCVTARPRTSGWRRLCVCVCGAVFICVCMHGVYVCVALWYMCGVVCVVWCVHVCVMYSVYCVCVLCCVLCALCTCVFLRVMCSMCVVCVMHSEC